MTSLLDAYFSLSLGLKSSSMPFVATAILAKRYYYKFFLFA
ncbi:hypothetical protein [Undibacterium fentianense]|nr:hypothetical protein [Undibacterium fentianense]